MQYATPDIQGIQLILTSIRLEGTSPAEEKKAAYVTRELLASAREVLRVMSSVGGRSQSQPIASFWGTSHKPPSFNSSSR